MKNQKLFDELWNEITSMPGIGTASHIGKTDAKQLAVTICKLQVEACLDAFKNASERINYKPSATQIDALKKSKLF